MSDRPHAHDDDRRKKHSCSTRPSALLTELREHLPFSVAAVAIGLIVAGVICIIVSGGGAAAGAGHDNALNESATHDEAAHGAAVHEHGYDDQPATLFFHLFHPAHMLFSALTTVAMFCRYERRILKAVVVGLIGAIGVCGLSDIAIPQVSLLFLGTQAPWHICVIEHPMIVLPFAVVGVLVGITAAGSVHKSTIISHWLHVFVSTMASIFYMVGPLGIVDWIHDIGRVFMFVVIAVMVPCCLSDIVFPMLMTKAGRERYEKEPHVH